MHHAIYLTQRASPSTRARATSASRSKTRLHPYAQSSCLSPPHSSFLITPASSVPSSSPSPAPFLDRPRHTPAPASTSQIPKNPPPRDPHKTRYVIGLVDQAVKSLCEIWHPNHIPEVFCTSSRVTVIPSKTSSSIKHGLDLSARFHNQNTQLPSPISPDSLTSPRNSSLSLVSAETRDGQQNSDNDAQNNLVPLKGFVHEVLRRSRTSGNVLQTALCYLEAIRSKVPELAKQEAAGEGVKGEIQSADRIIKAEDLSDAEAEAIGMSVPLESIINTDSCASAKQTDEGVLATVLCTDNDVMDASATNFSNPPPLARGDDLHASEILAKKHNKCASVPLPPLPPLPSPLLCPRRAFLAALILASKFTQDRCYSNKAWSKLSGLPPREIGRCERALGDALEWRLWVGKTPTPPPPPTPITNTHNGRAVVRSRSEGDLLPRAKAIGSSKKGMKCLHKKDVELFGYPRDWDTAGRPLDGSQHNSIGVSTTWEGSSQLKSLSGSTLRRHSSLPADTFVNDECSMPIPGPSTQTDTPPEPPGCEIHMVCETASVPQTTFDTVDSSPIPPTPPLSFSPASTESNSDGDRTIQMSGFIELSTPPPNGGLFQKAQALPLLMFRMDVDIPPLALHQGPTQLIVE